VKSQALADQSTDQVYGPGVTFSNATLYAQARRADLAVGLLEQVFAAPGGGQVYAPRLLPIDPVWDPIRHDPPFVALLKKYAADAPAQTAP
ncbi:MAG: hypothetical protein ACREPT_01535, partial [Rudaea sp.]